MTGTDPFEGTVYRYLANADDAVQLARFFGVEGGIDYDTAEAVDQIDRAIASLQSARAILTVVVGS